MAGVRGPRLSQVQACRDRTWSSRAKDRPEPPAPAYRDPPWTSSDLTEAPWSLRAGLCSVSENGTELVRAPCPCPDFGHGPWNLRGRGHDHLDDHAVHAAPFRAGHVLYVVGLARDRAAALFQRDPLLVFFVAHRVPPGASSRPALVLVPPSCVPPWQCAASLPRWRLPFVAALP